MNDVQKGQAMRQRHFRRTRLGVGIYLAILLIVGCFVPTGYGQSEDGAAGAIIAQVVVVGNDKVSTETILAKVRTRAGARLDEEILADDARRIIVMPQVYDVKFEVVPVGDKVDVRFLVSESPQVKSVRLLGNKNIKTDELMKLLEFNSGDYLDFYLVNHGAELLQDYYHEKGYYFAEVNLNRELLRLEREVVYVIVEGPKLRIKKVVFEGNESFGRGKLKSKLKTKAYFPIFSKGRLDDSKIEQDRLALMSFYRDEGFLDARVFAEPRFNEDKTRVRVAFIIDEGQRYKVSDIRFEGNEKFTIEQLAADLELASGEYLTKERRQRATGKVQDVMGREGHIYNDVDLVPQYTDAEGQVDAVFRIEEGKQYHLGQVIVSGNQQTKDKVVRREFDRYGFLPGKLYNTEARDKAERRLKGIGLFEEIAVTPIGDELDTRDALVEVAEARTGLLLFGVGIDTNSGLLGQFSIEQRNYDIARYPTSLRDFLQGNAWTGAGQRLRLDLEPGTDVTRARLKFYEPYLFDQPYYLDLSLFIFQRSRESHDERRTGGAVTLGRRFDNDWSVEAGIRIEQVYISDLDRGREIPGDPNSPMVPIAPQDVIDVRGDNFLTSATVGFGYDDTDSIYRPTEGQDFSAHWEQYGALGGDFEFSAITSSYKIFVPIYEDLSERRTVWAGRVRGAYIVAGDAPVFERYYAGGIGSIRGFDYRGVSPRAGRNNDPVGGDRMFLASTEVIHPLYQETLYGKVFVDSGWVEENPYRSAIGFGLEVLVPQLLQMVPMHFDFAWPFTQGELDDTQVFSFSFGLNV